VTTLSRQQAIELTYAADTDVGRSRQGKLNQDSFGSYEDYCNDGARLVAKGKLFVVADGMGGAAGGREASRIAVDVVFRSYYDDLDLDIVPSLQRAIQAANTQIHQHGQAHPELRGLGTTIVAAVIHGHTLVVGNVGDSRAYLLRQNQLMQLSVDHTTVQEQVRDGLLAPEKAAIHPRRHVLSRNLGYQPEAQPDFETQALLKGDAILLCSDGLWGPVEDNEIAGVLQDEHGEAAVERLIDLANERGGPDNISAILIHVVSIDELSTSMSAAGVGQAVSESSITEEATVEPAMPESSVHPETQSMPHLPSEESRNISEPWNSVSNNHDAPYSPRRRLWLIIGVGALLLLLGGVVAYLAIPSLGLQLSVFTNWSSRRSMTEVPGILPTGAGSLVAKPASSSSVSGAALAMGTPMLTGPSEPTATPVIPRRTLDVEFSAPVLPGDRPTHQRLLRHQHEPR